MTALDAPMWVAGSEERFLAFVRGLYEEDTIAVISHKADLDGIVSAKVVTSVVEPDVNELLDYSDLHGDFIDRLRTAKVSKIIISDMNFKRKEDILALEAFAEIMIIDHHQFQEDFNSERTVFMNAQGMCAAYLCYYLFSKICDCRAWEWAVACASLSDWAWKENQRWLSDVFSRHGSTFVGSEEGVKQNAFWDFQYKLYLALIYDKKNVMAFYEHFPREYNELGPLGSHIDEVQQEVNRALAAFDREKTLIGMRTFWEFSGKFPVRELVINMRSHASPTMTIVICERVGDIYKCSFRRQDVGEDVSILAKKLVEGFEYADGGGHKAAAGCGFPVKYFDEFKQRLQRE